jgi:hypothetical protein
VERSSELVGRILQRCLDAGRAVEIDGLGVFRPSASGDYEFEAQTEPKVFLAYVQEDLAAAERLFEDLRARRFDPWLDRKKLLPGQNWPRAIERAIEVSDFFVACFSGKSAGKRGQFQAELRYALDCASRMPLDLTYFIPVRLEECAVPRRIMREIQYVDMFPDWDKGLQRIVASMRKPKEVRRKERLRLVG